MIGIVTRGRDTVAPTGGAALQAGRLQCPMSSNQGQGRDPGHGAGAAAETGTVSAVHIMALVS